MLELRQVRPQPLRTYTLQLADHSTIRCYIMSYRQQELNDRSFTVTGNWTLNLSVLQPPACQFIYHTSILSPRKAIPRCPCCRSQYCPVSQAAVSSVLPAVKQKLPELYKPTYEHAFRNLETFQMKRLFYQQQQSIWAGIAQSVERLAGGWTFRGSKAGGVEIFRTRPYRPWSPHSLLYSGYRASFPGLERPRRGVNHPPPSSAEVKERVNL